MYVNINRAMYLKSQDNDLASIQLGGSKVERYGGEVEGGVARVTRIAVQAVTLIWYAKPGIQDLAHKKGT